MTDKMYVDIRQKMLDEQKRRFFLEMRASDIKNTNVRENVKQLIKNKEYDFAHEVIIANEINKNNND